MELILRQGGREARVTVEGSGRRFAVRVDDRLYDVDLEVSGRARSLLIAGRQYEVTVETPAPGRYRVTGPGGLADIEALDVLAHLAEKSHGSSTPTGRNRVDAYMPGRVVTLLVEPGAAVKAGEGVLVLEAMKMENEVQAERDGVVREFFVAAGEAVESGDPLYELD